jgi:hypothetical protein
MESGMPIRQITFHRDWRDWISQKLRTMIARSQERQPSRPYLGRSLDKFERFVPHLDQITEIIFQLEDVCVLVNSDDDEERWAPSAASKFLHYLTGIGVIEIRQAGRAGNGYRLLKNFALAPDPSRQSGTGRIPRADLVVEGDKNIEIPKEVELDPMPAPELAPMEAADPEETSEIVELDGDILMSAINQISANLGSISLDFRKTLDDAPAAVAYTAQNKISKAMADLHRLRSAIRRGDGTPLQKILAGA